MFVRGSSWEGECPCSARGLRAFHKPQRPEPKPVRIRILPTTRLSFRTKDPNPTPKIMTRVPRNSDPTTWPKVVHIVTVIVRARDHFWARARTAMGSQWSGKMACKKATLAPARSRMVNECNVLLLFVGYKASIAGFSSSRYQTPLNIMPAHSPAPAKPGGELYSEYWWGQAGGGLLAARRGFSCVPWAAT